MGIEALTRTADGAFVVPMSDAEWDDWVSASATRNYVLGDPLLDWLERCGEEHGFRPDDAGSFDVRTDFLTFIFRKGAEFESAVVDHLRTLVEVTTILGAPAAHAARRDLAVAEATFEAMCAQAGVSGWWCPQKMSRRRGSWQGWRCTASTASSSCARTPRGGQSRRLPRASGRSRWRCTTSRWCAGRST